MKVDGKDYGRNANCEMFTLYHQEILKTSPITKWLFGTLNFDFISSCFCTCEAGDIKVDRHFSLYETVSDIDQNK